MVSILLKNLDYNKIYFLFYFFENYLQKNLIQSKFWNKIIINYILNSITIYWKTLFPAA